MYNKMASRDCNIYNQYNSDTVDPNGDFNPAKCFKGSMVYSKMKDLHINDFKKYKSKDYYNFINENLSEYSFPKDYIDMSFDSICNPNEYSLKPQQKFAGRIFNTHVENRGLLIYHGLGSGKTQTSIVIGESFKFRKVNGQPITTHQIAGEPPSGRSQNHVLVVVPASLVDQYFAEIIGVLDNDKIKSASGEIRIDGEQQYYLNKKTRISINNLTRQLERILLKMEDIEPDDPTYTNLYNQWVQYDKQLTFLKEEENKKVSLVYEILSHERFLNRLYDSSVTSFKEGDYLSKLANPNGLLIIDEAHRLVSATGTSYRKLLFALNYHAHPSFRVVLLSGSPIYDKPFEFGLMMNLLRPRMVFPDGSDKFNEVFIKPIERKGPTVIAPAMMINDELFKKMTSGYVSYFKGGNPESYPYKKTIIMNHSMDPYQYGIYKDALMKEIEKDKDRASSPEEDFLIKMVSTESKSDEVSTSVFNNSRLYCNIVFPEIVLTPEQLDQIKRNKSRVRDIVAEAGLGRFRQILNTAVRSSPKDLVKTNVLNKTKEFSSKFAKVAEIVEQSEGPVFIYSNYVTYGVEPMAIILNALGYAAFPKGSPGKSYFIWKGGVLPDEVNKAKTVFNSKENVNGLKLKIILGTQSVMEGVDFRAVRQIHVLDPWWNDSRMQQVIARGIRLCSHKDLPPEKRITDVFIHLASLGSGERLFRVTYTKPEKMSGETIEVSKLSTLTPGNPSAPSNEWFFYEAAIFLDQINGLKNIHEMVKDDSKFYANQIVSYKKIVDPQLTKKFGGWKGLDSMTVEEYMYSRALDKLHLNRQFENAIKEVSVDCQINKYGNIIRLDECYDPVGEDVYTLHYENYSTGKRYLRSGIKSQFNPKLPEGSFTLQDILNNTAKKSSSYNFTDVVTGETLKIPKSLIVSEEIDCDAGNIEYSFENIPEQIVDLTINKELAKYIKKIDINQLKRFLKEIEMGKIKVSDPKLIGKIKKFYNKDALTEKQQIIEKLNQLGVGEEDTPWEFETPEALKKLYRSITQKRYI